MRAQGMRLTTPMYDRLAGVWNLKKISAVPPEGEPKGFYIELVRGMLIKSRISIYFEIPHASEKPGWPENPANRIIMGDHKIPFATGTFFIEQSYSHMGAASVCFYDCRVGPENEKRNLILVLRIKGQSLQNEFKAFRQSIGFLY